MSISQEVTTVSFSRTLSLTKECRVTLKLVAAATLALVGMQDFPSAFAHQDIRLTICIPYYKGASCAKSDEPPSYNYGDDVVVKGRTIPKHGGTVAIHRRKGSRPWRTVARVDIEDGRYRYVWHTKRKHADQNTPYKFRSVLPNHDKSRVQRVYVLFGE